MYIAAKAFLTIKQIELIRKKKFIVVAFDLKNEAFVVHVIFINSDSNIYLFYRAQIAFLKANKTLISVSLKYADFANVFSTNLSAELPE